MSLGYENLKSTVRTSSGQLEDVPEDPKLASTARTTARRTAASNRQPGRLSGAYEYNDRDESENSKDKKRG